MENNELEYVGFWARTGASIIDIIIIIAITWPILFYIYGFDYFINPDRPLISGTADTLISWIFPAIATIIFWLSKQATPGKMAISAQIVDAKTGKRLTTGQAACRYIAYFISMLPLFLGIIWIAFDSRKQGWHDKLTGTVVIRPKNRKTEQVKFET
jgi:uncharacterized RDD family membrane protein YckC